MGRSKIDAAKRLRTVQACDGCKRRKTKCDGKTPCEACIRRDLRDPCRYHGNRENSSDGSLSSQQTSAKGSTGPSSVSSRRSLEMVSEGLLKEPVSDDALVLTSQETSRRAEDPTTSSKGSRPYTCTPSISNSPMVSPKPPSRVNEASEEIEVRLLDDSQKADYYVVPRPIEDELGRLVYAGASANISFIQFLRTIVEEVVGPNSFSADATRDRVIDPELTLSPAIAITGNPPDSEMAKILVASFFNNTHGIIELFNRQPFLRKLDQWYQEPMRIERSWLCQLFLILACGLCLATPQKGSRDAKLLSKLPENQGEIFYASAMSYSDPLVGVETTGFWSIQALALMSFYMLCKSKGNIAFANVWMAIRSAHALGLHQEESLVMVEPAEQQERRMTWRSLFILDRFLAASLGRPCAIAEEESSAGLTQLSEEERRVLFRAKHGFCSAALDATFEACHNMGLVLGKMYRTTGTSTQEAEELAEECRKWMASLPAQLHWRNDSTKKVGQTMAILHCYLTHYHSIILLARPFFVSLVSNEIQRNRLSKDVASVRQLSAETGRFSTACVTAAKHSITIIYTAYTDGVLPRLDPFSTYSILAASFIVCANEFAFPDLTPREDSWIEKSIELLRYCGELDPCAREAAKTLQKFLGASSSAQRSAFESQSITSPPCSVVATADTGPSFSSKGERVRGAVLSELPRQPPPAGEAALDPVAILQQNANVEGPMTGFDPLMDMSFDNDLFHIGDLEQTVFPTCSDASSETALNVDTFWPWNFGFQN